MRCGRTARSPVRPDASPGPLQRASGAGGFLVVLKILRERAPDNLPLLDLTAEQDGDQIRTAGARPAAHCGRQRQVIGGEQTKKTKRLDFRNFVVTMRSAFGAFLACSLLAMGLAGRSFAEAVCATTQPAATQPRPARP